MTDEVIIIKIFDNEVEAEIAKGLLKKAGITALISKDDVGSIYPSLTRAEG